MRLRNKSANYPPMRCETVKLWRISPTRLIKSPCFWLGGRFAERFEKLPGSAGHQAELSCCLEKQKALLQELSYLG
jgi:hypothetical protein